MASFISREITDSTDFNSTINNLDTAYKDVIKAKSATFRGKAITKLNTILRHLGFTRQFAVVDKTTTTELAKHIYKLSSNVLKNPERFPEIDKKIVDRLFNTLEKNAGAEGKKVVKKCHQDVDALFKQIVKKEEEPRAKGETKPEDNPKVEDKSKAKEDKPKAKDEMSKDETKTEESKVEDKSRDKDKTKTEEPTNKSKTEHKPLDTLKKEVFLVAASMKKAEKLGQEGKRVESKQAYEQTIETLDKLIHTNPQATEPRRARAEAYTQLKRYEEALNDLNAVIAAEGVKPEEHMAALKARAAVYTTRAEDNDEKLLNKRTERSAIQVEISGTEIIKQDGWNDEEDKWINETLPKFRNEALEALDDEIIAKLDRMLVKEYWNKSMGEIPKKIMEKLKVDEEEHVTSDLDGVSDDLIKEFKDMLVADDVEYGRAGIIFPTDEEIAEKKTELIADLDEETILEMLEKKGKQLIANVDKSVKDLKDVEKIKKKKELLEKGGLNSIRLAKKGIRALQRENAFDYDESVEKFSTERKSAAKPLEIKSKKLIASENALEKNIKQDLDSALNDWNEIINKNPKDVFALGRRAVTHTLLNNFKQASKDFATIENLQVARLIKENLPKLREDPYLTSHQGLLAIKEAESLAAEEIETKIYLLNKAVAFLNRSLQEKPNDIFALRHRERVHGNLSDMYEKWAPDNKVIEELLSSEELNQIKDFSVELKEATEEELKKLGVSKEEYNESTKKLLEEIRNKHPEAPPLWAILSSTEENRRIKDAQQLVRLIQDEE